MVWILINSAGDCEFEEAWSPMPTGKVHNENDNSLPVSVNILKMLHYSTIEAMPF